ncbi:peptidase T [Fimbriiglobus ruber]|uniref:Peptidase T n=1 Tax=Fimbriiglobus ruber TaxID=1908690 RepID=A0A225DQ02_9BACT|nr:peptidase T [Fimbriiglobus ruber]OWK43442.1 Tripeptide aminopeptidase [Fimbriiglobus ruber]
MDTLLDRFLRYARIDTQADERATTYPSTPGQLVLAKLLRDELLAMGYADARQTEFGIVHATIPATVPGAPVVALNSHVDTSPEFSGHGVNPVIHANYAGGDIVLPKDTSRVIRMSENPELNHLIGKTIITTDGTTLLGADDKAGVAVIMEVAKLLAEDKTIPHGVVKIVFTCDEEIGKGVLHLEPADIGADVAYTLDGQGTAEVEGETFSADKATVTITGVNIHPSIAKGRMVNAIRLAGMFLERLPKRTLTPETTAEREGFLHPYTIDGGVPQTKIYFLLRDFETPRLAEQAELLRTIAQYLTREYPEATIDVSVVKQYRNMRDGMDKEPRAVPYALEAVRRTGLEPKQLSIRGGTDGAQLTAKGLPTPNLSCGEHNPHSPLEWTCLEEMRTNVKTVVELLKVWAGK